VILTTRRAAAYQIKILLLKMFRAVALIVFTTSALVFAEEDGGYGSTQQHHYGGKYDEYPQQGNNQYPQQQQQYDPYHQPQYHAPAPVYPTPAPTKPYIVAAPATPPPDFVAPEEPYPVYHPEAQCNEKCKPNSAKYMAYVCSSLYASALKWGNNNCKGYYAVENAYNKNSLYQARLCTYWTQRSVMRVVTSCFIEAHLRNEFVMKHGKEGPGVWFCRYKEFVDQVLDCYKSSLKYYPLGAGMNNIEQTVAALYTPNKDDMPPFQFTGASVAMCAYYNNDQVYNRGSY